MTKMMAKKNPFQGKFVFHKGSPYLLGLKAILIIVILIFTYIFRLLAPKAFDTSTCFTGEMKYDTSSYIEQTLPVSMNHISEVAIYGGENALPLNIKVSDGDKTLYNDLVEPSNSWYSISFSSDVKITEKSLTFTLFSPYEDQHISLPIAESTILTNLGNHFFNMQSGTASLNSTLQIHIQYQLKNNLMLIVAFVMILMVAFSGTKLSSTLICKLKNKKFILFIGLLILGTFVFILRYPFFFNENLLYAEDGAFLGEALRNGFWKMALGPRGGFEGGFSNFFLYALTYLSFTITTFIFNGNITNMPIVLGIIANLFFSLNATLLFFAIKKYFGTYMGLLSYLMVLFIPVGGNEGYMFGKVLQISFICPILALSLLLLRDHNKITIKNFTIDTFILLLALTFPVVYGIIALYLFLNIFQVINRKFDLKFYFKNSLYLLVTLCYGMTQFPKFSNNKGGTTELLFAPENFINFSIWKTFLYPLLSNFYDQLNDNIMIICFLLYILIIALSLWIRIYSKKITKAYLFIVGSMFIYAFATIVMRNGLTSLILGYNFSFVDWYFYGNNILSLLVFLIAIHDIILFELSGISDIGILNQGKNTIKTFFVVFMSVFLLNNYTFVKYNPSILTENPGTLKNSIKNSLSEDRGNTEYNIFPIHIYPAPNWEMDMPKEYLIATIEQS